MRTDALLGPGDPLQPRCPRSLEVEDEAGPVTRFQLDRDTFRDQAPRRLQGPALRAGGEQVSRACARSPRVPERAVQGEALLEERSRARVVGTSQSDSAERPEPVRDAADVSDPTRRPHTFRYQALGVVELSSPRTHDAAVEARVCLCHRVARALRYLQRFLGQRECPVGVTESEGGGPHDTKYYRERAIVAQTTKNTQACVAQPAHRLMVALDVRERRDPGLSQSSGATRPGARGQEPFEVLTALRVSRTSELPEAPECRGDSQADLCLAAL